MIASDTTTNMYQIYNKALDDESGKVLYDINKVNTDQALEILDFIGIEPEIESEDPDTGAPKYNQVELRKLLKNALAFNWNGQITAKTPFREADNKKRVDETIDRDEFFEIYQIEGLGIYKLAPGQTQEIRHVKSLVENLVQTGLADKLRITDLETGDIIWDGGLTKYSYDTIEINYEGKKVKNKHEAKSICNLVHPEKKREIYYPVKKNSGLESIVGPEVDLNKIDYESMNFFELRDLYTKKTGKPRDLKMTKKDIINALTNA